MVEFTAEIERFDKKGEKSNWTYILVPAAVANSIKADWRKSFRVKGTLDQFLLSGVALIPLGEGDFILPFNQQIKKGVNKKVGQTVLARLEEDKHFKIEIPDDLFDCLSEQPHLMEGFVALPKSHQNYFIKWINEAKTVETRVKRLTQTVIAMDNKWTYSEMIRANKK